MVACQRADPIHDAIYLEPFGIVKAASPDRPSGALISVTLCDQAPVGQAVMNHEADCAGRLARRERMWNLSWLPIFNQLPVQHLLEEPRLPEKALDVSRLDLYLTCWYAHA